MKHRYYPPRMTDMEKMQRAWNATSAAQEDRERLYREMDERKTMNDKEQAVLYAARAVVATYKSQGVAPANPLVKRLVEAAEALWEPPPPAPPKPMGAEERAKRLHSVLSFASFGADQRALIEGAIREAESAARRVALEEALALTCKDQGLSAYQADIRWLLDGGEFRP